MMSFEGIGYLAVIFFTKTKFPDGFVVVVTVIIIELTHSKTILEIPVEIEPQPAALDFKNLSQCSSRSK